VISGTSPPPTNPDIKRELKKQLLSMSARSFEFFAGDFLVYTGLEAISVTRYIGDGGIDAQGDLVAGMFRIPTGVQVNAPPCAARRRKKVEQVQEEKTRGGHQNHPRRSEGRRMMRMSFDLNEAVFDEQGQYLEEKASRYEEALMNLFAASPEGQAIKEKGTELGWAGAMIHYAISYLGVTPVTMTPSDLEEVIYDLFPRKVITERGDGAEIIQELGAFWHFLQRVYQLPQAKPMLARLRPQAVRRLEQALQEPANFGMAKSFVLMGQEAGFDMESPEGMQAWVEAYNATVAPTLAAASWRPEPATNKQSRAVSRGRLNAQRRKKKRTPPQ
jgi:hypothetical protein